MKILVTGDAGFIASHIADKYRALGHTVISVDNRHKKPIDINDADALTKLFMKEKPDIVNHHAAIIEVTKSVREPIPVFQTNTIGTINMLIAAGACGTVKKFIFSSTAAVYNDPKKIPVPETTTTSPLSPYGLSKLLAEQAIAFYSARFGFDYLIFRYANVYGPRQNPKGEAGVVAIFTDLMKNKKQPTIFGDGSKSRDYVYVEDIVRANALALRKGKNEIINIGWGKTITDKSVFDEIKKNVGFTGEPLYADIRPGEVYKIALESKKAFAVIGWKPTISLAQGVKRHVRALENA